MKFNLRTVQLNGRSGYKIQQYKHSFKANQETKNSYKSETGYETMCSQRTSISCRVLTVRRCSYFVNKTLILPINSMKLILSTCSSF